MPAPHSTLARLKRPLLYVMGPLYVVAGLLHFVYPQVYAQIVPPFLPQPLVLVSLSGIAEVVLGVGVLVPHSRKIAAWGARRPAPGSVPGERLHGDQRCRDSGRSGLAR